VAQIPAFVRTSPTFPSLAWSAPGAVVEVQIYRNVNVNSERAGLLHLQLTTALTTINFSAGEGGQTIGRQVPGRQAATSPPPPACYRRTGRRARDARHQRASAASAELAGAAVRQPVVTDDRRETAGRDPPLQSGAQRVGSGYRRRRSSSTAHRIAEPEMTGSVTGSETEVTDPGSRATRAFLRTAVTTRPGRDGYSQCPAVVPTTGTSDGPS